MMHSGGYNNRPSMMHGGGGGMHKQRPSLLAGAGRPRPGGRHDDRFDEGEIGEIPERGGAMDNRSREPWDTRDRDRQWGDRQRADPSSFAAPDEDGELPVAGGSHQPPLPDGAPPSGTAQRSSDILKQVSAAPTPTMELYTGTAEKAPMSRHLSAPPGAVDTSNESDSPAPKRKKLGWGQGLHRSKSTGAADAPPAYPDRPPSVPIPTDELRSDNKTPPPPFPVGLANPFGDDSRDASNSGFGMHSVGKQSGIPSSLPRTGQKPPLDPVARAAQAAASKADAAARRETLQNSEKTKAEILRLMEETDSRIASLEREIEASDEKNENDREQVEEQRTHQEARLRRELEGVKSNVERAEKASKRADTAAKEAQAGAEEMRRKAGLIDAEEREKEKKDGKKKERQEFKEKEAAAAKASAKAVQRMLSGNEPRVALVDRVIGRNSKLAITSHLGLRDVCGLPLPHEATKISVEEIVERNLSTEKNDHTREGVRSAVTQVLRARRELTREKAVQLAVVYLKRREQWRLHMQRKDLALFEMEMGVKPGGKLPALSTRGSSRHAIGGLGGTRGSFGGAARSEYEEIQMIAELQARERLKTLVKLPSQILDPEEIRLSAFSQNRNALVEDPKQEVELLKHTRPWVEWEKKIFHEKFASYGKNFKRIATFIDGRTTAECVVYYYQRQKTEDGFKGRRRAQAKKRRAYAEAKRMTGGAWNGPGGASTMSAAALAKASREREAELRAAEEERKGRSAEARQERAALAAAEKKKAKEKAAREKKKREKEERLAREKEELEQLESDTRAKKAPKKGKAEGKGKPSKEKEGSPETGDRDDEEKTNAGDAADPIAVAAAANQAYQQAAAAAAAMAASDPAVAAAMADPAAQQIEAQMALGVTQPGAAAAMMQMMAGGQAQAMATLAASGQVATLTGDTEAPATTQGTKRKAEDSEDSDKPAKGKGKGKKAKTAELPDDAKLKWGEGVEEK